jgi:hypothetical protein
MKNPRGKFRGIFVGYENFLPGLPGKNELEARGADGSPSPLTFLYTTLSYKTIGRIN